MLKDTKGSDLLVLEYGGSARSGKGTIVEYLSENHPAAAKEETGIDYRVLTRQLLENSQISPGMDHQKIARAVGGLSLDELSSIVADRQRKIEEYGKGSFYQTDVNNLVADVGKVEIARKAVKAGFAKRVERVRDSGEYSVLLIDGRNLYEVIEKIKGTRLLLRTFVTCLPLEAALRECTREGIELDSPDGQAILESIKSRNEKDAKRQLDPMKVEADALIYWGEEVQDAARAAEELTKNTTAKDYLLSVSRLKHKFPREHIQRGVGAKAVRSGRQISFDTTPFRLYEDPKAAMLYAANTMFEEALSNL